MGFFSALVPGTLAFLFDLPIIIDGDDFYVSPSQSDHRRICFSLRRMNQDGHWVGLLIDIVWYIGRTFFI